MTKFTGGNIIELGYEPGPWFRDVLRDVNDSDMSRQEAIITVKAAHDAWLSQQNIAAKDVISLQDSVEFIVNMTPENDAERHNVDMVVNGFKDLVRTPTIVAGALMPDACPSEPGAIPVGGVIGAKNAIHPGMHSADICCSMFLTVIDADPKDVLDAMAKVTHFGPGGRFDGRFQLDEDLLRRFSENPFMMNQKIMNAAQTHLGTQGDGNHFTYVGLNKKGKTVLVTHHGSRGVGALLYKAGMQMAKDYTAKASPDTNPKNSWLVADSVAGQAYWKALQLTREWTKENHRVLHDAALAELGISPDNRFWNEHNFVFADDDVFWHAKGATPIHNGFIPDTNGTQIIPMNMAQPILLVQGKRSSRNLGFAPHGAGRNMSRSQHVRSMGNTPIEEIFRRETKGLDARFFSGKIDISELPSAYKDADSVQRDMDKFGLAKVVERIEPYGCMMAGEQPPQPWIEAKAKKKADKAAKAAAEAEKDPTY